MVERLAWTLIHFVWEGTVVAILLGILLLATRRGSASLRYGLACFGLILMVACPVVTFFELIPAGSTAPTIDASRSGVTHFTIEETIVPESPVFPLLVQIWAVGVVLLSLRFVGTLIHLERWKRRHTSPADAGWQARVNVLAERMGITRGIRLLVSDRIGVPSAWGVLKSVVVLPASLLSQLSPAQIETILLHELAHIRRHDYLVNLVQTVVETALFYHPAVWWISSVVRRERENCCDDVVINSLADPMPYARALLQLEERRTMLPRPTLSAKGSNLMNRIARILGAKPAPIRISPLTSTLATLAVVAAVMGGTFQAQAQSTKPKPVPPKSTAKPKIKTKLKLKHGSKVAVAVHPSPAPKPMAAPKPAPAPKPVIVVAPKPPAASAPAAAPAPPAKPARVAIPARPPKPPKIDPATKPESAIPARLAPPDPTRTVNIPITLDPKTRVTLASPVKVNDVTNVTLTTVDPVATQVAARLNGIAYTAQAAPLTLNYSTSLYGKLNTTQTASVNYAAVKSLYGKLAATKSTHSSIAYAKALYGKAWAAPAKSATTSKQFVNYSTLAPLVAMKDPFSSAGFGTMNSFSSKTGVAANVFGGQRGTVNGVGVAGRGFQGARSIPAFGGNSFFGDGDISIDVKGGLASLDVKDARLSSTLRKLAKQSKLSVVIAAGRYEDVTLVLSDVAPGKALEIICRAAGAAYRLEGGVYYISPRPGGIATPAP